MGLIVVVIAKNYGFVLSQGIHCTNKYFVFVTLHIYLHDVRGRTRAIGNQGINGSRLHLSITRVGELTLAWSVGGV